MHEKGLIIKVGDVVETPQGKAEVIGANYLLKRCMVEFDDGKTGHYLFSELK